MKKKMLVTLITAIMMLSLAFAAEPSGAAVANGTEYGPINATVAGDLNVTAGFIQEANLATNQTTLRWAGLTGNVTGQIQIGDGASVDVMYSWTASGNLVYASVGVPAWSSLTNISGVDIDSEYSFMTTSDSDSANVTFDGVAESIGSAIFTIDAIYASTYNSTGSPFWKTYALYDLSKVIFVGKVADGTNFRGDFSDFQMILPEEGTLGDTSATEYTLWVELI